MRASEATAGVYGAFGGSVSYYTRENTDILIRVDINKPTIPLKPTGEGLPPSWASMPCSTCALARAKAAAVRAKLARHKDAMQRVGEFRALKQAKRDAAAGGGR